METKKLEQIIIIILALLNVFLLIVVLGDGAEARGSRRETEASLTALFAESGIAVGPEAELIQSGAVQCVVARDMEQEQRRMRGLLGRYSASDQGGSIWFYESGKGQAVMRGTGEMELLLTGEEVRRSGDGAREAAKLFSRAGVELYPLERAPEGDDSRLSLCCGWNGYPVYNAVMNFDFSGDRLYMVSGTMVFNVETESEPDAGMDSVSALVRFLELAKSEGFICSRLETVTPGYYVNVALSGESTLTPVWRIATDTGDFFINAVSGRMEGVPT